MSKSKRLNLSTHLELDSILEEKSVYKSRSKDDLFERLYNEGKVKKFKLQLLDNIKKEEEKKETQLKILKTRKTTAKKQRYLDKRLSQHNNNRRSCRSRKKSMDGKKFGGGNSGGISGRGSLGNTFF
jgi:hypothetical protein